MNRLVDLTRLILLSACVLTLAACSGVSEKAQIQAADPRDGHIEELEKAGQTAKNTGSVVVTMRPVRADEPFQPDELRIAKIPFDKISQDDVTHPRFAKGYFARKDFPVNHIVHQSELLAIVRDAWHQVYRAKQAIAVKDVFTEENTTCRFVRGQPEDAPDDKDNILFRQAIRPVEAGQIIHPSEAGPEKWTYVYHARKPIKKGETFDTTQLRSTLKKVDGNDAKDSADLHQSESYQATRDIDANECVKKADAQ